MARRGARPNRGTRGVQGRPPYLAPNNIARGPSQGQVRQGVGVPPIPQITTTPCLFSFFPPFFLPSL